jgi:energy-coupling factor transport system substrate-specific component
MAEGRTVAGVPVGKYYFTTFDLLTMALIGAVAGVLAAVALNPIATAISAALGPYGVGVSSAIFLIWPVISTLLIKKPGAALGTQVVAGVVQVLAGNALGITALWGAIVDGIGCEIGAAPFRWRANPWTAMASGAIGTLAGVWYFGNIVFGIPLDQLLPGLIAGLIAGAIIAGLGGYVVAQAINRSGVTAR